MSDNQTHAAPPGERLGALDGMRGIAVLLVVIYHYFGRFTVAEGQPLYPYGDVFARWPLVMDGQVGVDLFFMISGFVIFESLRRSGSPLAFAARRANRLVLPMVGMSLLTFCVLSVLPTPYFPVHLADFAPSWTFTTPGFWRWLDPEVSFVDPVYWTLFIEVRFYLLMAVLWFALGRSEARATAAIAVVALLAVTAQGFALQQGLTGWSGALDLLLFPAHICLFACGVLYNRLHRGVATSLEKVALALLAVLGALRVIGAPDDPALFINLIVWLALFHAGFILVARRSPLIGWLRWQPLVGIGLISYSLYLVHQGVGLALISRLPSNWPLPLQLAGVALVMALVTAIAWLSWRLLEQRRPFSALARPSDKTEALPRRAKA
jgi:peptidoglycan/LPS O-acetylase OafA/YrhL